MRAVDTNVLLRVILQDHPQQLKEAEAFLAGGAWVTAVPLAEVAWVLRSTFGFEQDSVADALEMLLQHPVLTIQDADAVGRAVDMYRVARGVSFTDCLILELARKNGHLPLGTFDRKLARLPGAERIAR
jgi:predicted nucleic-acid-binding protein